MKKKQEEVDESNKWKDIAYQSTYEVFSPYEGKWIYGDDEFIEFMTDGEKFFFIKAYTYESDSRIHYLYQAVIFCNR